MNFKLYIYIYYTEFPKYFSMDLQQHTKEKPLYYKETNAS